MASKMLIFRRRLRVGKVCGIVAVGVVLVKIVAVLEVIAFVPIEAIVVWSLVSRIIGVRSVASRGLVRAHGGQQEELFGIHSQQEEWSGMG